MPDASEILSRLEEKSSPKKNDIGLSFHPDQFIFLSSLHMNVVENNTRELEYQGMLAELIGADFGIFINSFRSSSSLHE